MQRDDALEIVRQMRTPFREETKAVGHAVLGMYLYAGAADVYAKTGEKALLEMTMATHSGQTQAEFETTVAGWLTEKKHPKTGELLTAMVFQPMLELIAYLRLNDFKVFITFSGAHWADKTR